MALVLKMQIDDRQEHQYIFSTGDDGTIELIPLSVVVNGSYPAPEGKAFNLVTVSVPEITLDELNVSTSGVYTAPDGHAYNVVTVDIPEYVLDALTATENGTYTPSDGHVYNRVVVNVPSEEPLIQSKTVTYTANGTYTVNKDSGYDGMSSVTVTVNVQTPTPTLQTKQVTVTQNGSSVITADTGYDGLDEVDLTVSVPTPTPTLQTKQVTVTQNGSSVITADSGYDGLEEVDLTVNVSGGGSLPSYMSVDTYTPSANSLGVDTVTLTHDANHYLIGLIIYDTGADSGLNAGAINMATVLKKTQYSAPSFSSATDIDAANVTTSYKTASSYNTTALSGMAVYGTTPSSSATGTPIGIPTGNQVSLYRKQSGNTTASVRGFVYGRTYRIIGIFDG